MTLIRAALILVACLLIYVAYRVLGRHPAYRHHVIPTLAIAITFLATLFPVATEVQYLVKAERLEFTRASDLSLQGELMLHRIFLTCTGLAASAKEVLLRRAENPRWSQPIRDFNLVLAEGGQWEISEIKPQYLPLEISYLSVRGKESVWILETREIAHGISLRVPLAPLKNFSILDVGSFALRGKRFTATADGRVFFNAGDVPKVFRLESRGNFPVEFDATKCQEGSLEFILEPGERKNRNRLVISKSQYVLRDPKFRGVKSVVRVLSGESVTISSGDVEDFGLVREIKRGEFLFSDGTISVELKLSRAVSLFSKYRVDPVLSTVVAIFVFWVSQIATHGWKIAKTEKGEGGSA